MRNGGAASVGGVLAPPLDSGGGSRGAGLSFLLGSVGCLATDETAGGKIPQKPWSAPFASKHLRSLSLQATARRPTHSLSLHIHFRHVHLSFPAPVNSILHHFSRDVRSLAGPPFQRYLTIDPGSFSGVVHTYVSRSPCFWSRFTRTYNRLLSAATRNLETPSFALSTLATTLLPVLAHAWADFAPYPSNTLPFMENGT